MKSNQEEQAKFFLLAMKKLKKMHFNHEMQEFNVKSSEFMILYTMKDLKRKKITEIKLSELTKLLKNAPSTLSPMIQSLVVKGFLQRRSDEKDRRVSYISFTNEGEAVTQKIDEKVKQSIAGYFLAFGEENTEQLLTLLTQFGDVIEKQREKEKVGEKHD